MGGEAHHLKVELLSDILLKETGISEATCYQCGKCTAGCPMALEMDLTPSQIMRFLQLGLPELEDRVLRSISIWYCLTCETCYARCPQEVDIPVIMDFLRAESLSRGMAHPGAKDIIAFHRSFLDSVRHTGKLNELGLIILYKLRSFHFIKDLLLAPKMFFKGKLGILPHRIKERKKMKSIFKKTIRKKKKGG